MKNKLLATSLSVLVLAFLLLLDPVQLGSGQSTGILNVYGYGGGAGGGARAFYAPHFSVIPSPRAPLTVAPPVQPPANVPPKSTPPVNVPRANPPQAPPSPPSFLSQGNGPAQGNGPQGSGNGLTGFASLNETGQPSGNGLGNWLSNLWHSIFG